jgi:hypothetical protein
MLPYASPRRWSSQYPKPRRGIPKSIGMAVALLILLGGTITHLKVRSNNHTKTNSHRVMSLNPKDTPSPKLLDNFCVVEDATATGWSHLTPLECMAQFTSIKTRAVHDIKTNSSNAMLLFKHVHKAGGTTLCHLASKNMIVEDVPLPFRSDWTTNCVPYESFLGPYPAIGGGILLFHSASRHLLGTWLGGACFLGFLSPAQFSVLPRHYRPLTFAASEGAFPTVMPLDAPLAMVTMLRNPLDRVLSSYQWFRFMITAMPHSPTECRAYYAPSNATFEEWLDWYPDNWMTRELAGNEALYRKNSQGRPGALTADDILKAKQRLHYFAAILIMERPEESELLLKNLFGWKVVDLDSHRAGSIRNSSAEKELDSAVFQKVYAMNTHDIDIYNYALELHKTQVGKVRNRSD